jgi:hypothetical protein
MSLITLAARASTFGGIAFRFLILNCSIIGLLCQLSPKHLVE